MQQIRIASGGAKRKGEEINQKQTKKPTSRKKVRARSISRSEISSENRGGKRENVSSMVKLTWIPKLPPGRKGNPNSTIWGGRKKPGDDQPSTRRKNALNLNWTGHQTQDPQQFRGSIANARNSGQSTSWSWSKESPFL